MAGSTAGHFCIYSLFRLSHDVHFVNQSLAIAIFLNDEEHITDIHVYATLQLLVEIDVAAQRLPVAIECKANELAA